MRSNITCLEFAQLLEGFYLSIRHNRMLILHLKVYSCPAWEYLDSTVLSTVCLEKLVLTAVNKSLDDESEIFTSRSCSL